MSNVVHPEAKLDTAYPPAGSSAQPENQQPPRYPPPAYEQHTFNKPVQQQPQQQQPQSQQQQQQQQPQQQQPQQQQPQQQQQLRSGGTSIIVQQQAVTGGGGNIVLPHFGHSPVYMVCPFCKYTMTTDVTYTVGCFTWLLVFILFFVGLSAGCCLIPFCVPACKDAHHECANCHQMLGTHKKL